MDVLAPRMRFADKAQGAFYKQVRNETDSYLRGRGGGFAPPIVWLKFAGLLLIGGVCYGFALADVFPLWARLGFYVGFGVACLLLVLNVSHDAAHDSLSRNRTVNRIVHALLFNLMGADSDMWRTRHVHSHHVYPNILGCDADIDANYLLRLSPHHPHRWYQRVQHLYAPLVYLLVNLHSIFVQDPVYLFKRRLANITQERPTARRIVRFLAAKAYYFGIVLGLPFLVVDLPAWQVLTAYLIMTAVASSIFIVLLIGTHFAMECAFPGVDETGRVSNSWSRHSVAASLDWSPRSPIANFLCGGLNAHAAHHLFPRVSHAHYVEISRIIKRNARRYGVRYNETTFLGMVRSHFRFLREMGREPRAGNAVVLPRLPGPAARPS